MNQRIGRPKANWKGKPARKSAGIGTGLGQGGIQVWQLLG